MMKLDQGSSIEDVARDPKTFVVFLHHETSLRAYAANVSTNAFKPH